MAHSDFTSIPYPPSSETVLEFRPIVMGCVPPPLPPGSVYTSCWCEENVYLLCQNFLDDSAVKESWEVFVVFISNQDKSVALWCQKAARGEGEPVVWDYHVILVLRPRNREDDVRTGFPTYTQSWVYDFDTCLSLPCGWEEYLFMTFPEGVLTPYESQFRVIPGEQFLQHFASDRSHMIVKSTAGQILYSSPPPPYAPICGPSSTHNGIKNNLMSNYVCMAQNEGARQDIYGVEMNRTEAGIFF